MKTFISYAREDLGYVEQLCVQLQRQGVQVWFDKNLETGDDWLKMIEAEIEASQAVLVILSPNTDHAVGVKREVLKAQSLNKHILPILIDGLKENDIPMWIIEKHYADARNNRDPIPEILRSLNITKPNPSNPSTQSRRVPSGALSNLTGSLIIVPDGGHFSEDRIGANSRLVGSNRVGILSSYPNDLRSVQLPVRLVPLDFLPENALVITKRLQETLGLHASSADAWQFEFQAFQLASIQKLTLELTVEISLEDAVSELERSKELTGHLVWGGGRYDPAAYEAILLELSGRPYRIAQLEPLPNNPNMILEVNSSTDVSVFSSSAKSGVDIVILADCSGSMGLEDLTDNSDHTPQEGWKFFSKSSQQKNLSRMEALRKSLKQLLEMRLRISGRVSRIALVAFTRDSHVRFPRSGTGMSEIDGSSSSELIKDFKDAIGLLRAEKAGTDIGQGLHFAAELLHRNGHPGNERLIVLISDGADWQPKGSDSTGEEVSGIEDPISLMAHLHETMDIRLHAVGISDLSIFERWWQKNYSGREPHVSMIPNHDLLNRLVEVGGNDPSRTGDTAVLEEYFSGLGRGVTRKVFCPKLISPSPLKNEERENILLNSQGIRSEQILSGFRREREQLVEIIYEKYISVNEHATAIAGEELLTPAAGMQSLFLQLNQDIVNAKEMRNFANSLLSLVFNAIPKNPNRFVVPDAVKLISSTFAANVRYIVEQFNGYLLNTDQPKAPIDLGRFAVELSGNSSIAYDDVETWNSAQIYCLRETVAILQKVQALLLETLVVEEQSTLSEDNDAHTFRFIG